MITTSAWPHTGLPELLPGVPGSTTLQAGACRRSYARPSRISGRTSAGAAAGTHAMAVVHLPVNLLPFGVLRSFVEAPPVRQAAELTAAGLPPGLGQHHLDHVPCPG